MLAALHVPMFGFTCLAFLLIYVVIAVAILLVFKSGEKGTTKLGGFAGCMIGLGLFGIAGLMALGTGLVMTLNAWNEAVRRGPVKSFEFHFDDGSRLHGAEGERTTRDWEPEGEHGGEHGGELSTEDRAAGAEELGGMDAAPGRGKLEIVVLLRDEGAATTVIDWVREHVDADLSTEWGTVSTDEGEFTRVTFTAELERAELERVKSDLQRDFPGFELPTGGKIELREPTR
ncbi:MAG: hypothetical protein IPJ77_21000 [Planctomycetes bacterium]|nr:hypothetical protein [Planctomycetota bacterium]